MSSENELKKKFNDFFLEEDPWHKLNTCRDKIYKIKVLNFLSMYNYKNVLDLGCGEGDFTYLISNKVKKIDAVDISSIAIDRAKQKYQNSNITYFNMGALEFCSQTTLKKYDLIFALEMLYYLNDKERIELLELISNLLQDNGILYIGLVVSGKNKYGKYFTYDSACNLLSKYFKIISITTAVPKGFKEIPLRKFIIKILCILKKT